MAVQNLTIVQVKNPRDADNALFIGFNSTDPSNQSFFVFYGCDNSPSSYEEQDFWHVWNVGEHPFCNPLIPAGGPEKAFVQWVEFESIHLHARRQTWGMVRMHPDLLPHLEAESEVLTSFFHNLRALRFPDLWDKVYKDVHQITNADAFNALMAIQADAIAGRLPTPSN